MVTSSTPLTSGSTGDAWEKAARAGYAVSGGIHIALGFLIARIAFGSGEEADQSNVLSGLSDNAWGMVVLWVAVAAFVALGTWQLADAFRSGQEGKERGKALGKSVVYLALAVTAGSFALGSGGSEGDSQAQGAASTLMEAPAGRALVGAVGLGILAAGIFHIWKGATKRFLRDLKGTPGNGGSSGVSTIGMAGYIAKGVALGVVGVLFTYAAVTADPDKAQGLDGAVQSLLDLPGGPVLVVLVGLGFAAYGVYSFARARYARM